MTLNNNKYQQDLADAIEQHMPPALRNIRVWGLGRASQSLSFRCTAILVSEWCESRGLLHLGLFEWQVLCQKALRWRKLYAVVNERRYVQTPKLGLRHKRIDKRSALSINIIRQLARQSGLHKPNADPYRINHEVSMQMWKMAREKFVAGIAGRAIDRAVGRILKPHRGTTTLRSEIPSISYCAANPFTNRPRSNVVLDAPDQSQSAAAPALQ